jgi:DNA topoisomerase-1
MSSNLLIVESPAKAKTIEKYLGKDFIVRSSYGHIRDLAKTDMGVEIENGFKPQYVISSDKKKVVKELKGLLKNNKEVWLATDEDREGEAISWHLCEVLGLDPKTTKRIVFREITKSAIQKAVKKPRTVDLNLVDAQQARRILDRLVGFELSGLLWKKVKGGLSAGRVQSVTVRLVAEKERAIQSFETESFFRIYAYFDVEHKNGSKATLKAECSDRLKDIEEAQTFLEASADSQFEISDVLVKPAKRRPAAPFTTSTLQQDASRKLYFSVQRTMSVAQKLYERGLITYMRTDSTNLSNAAIASIEQRVIADYGKKYSKVRRYKGKSKGAQEAHEAIRPTDINTTSIQGDRDAQRLYDLIWKRTIASQMSDAELEKTTVTIDISKLPDRNLQAKGEVIVFDGFIKVYMESSDDDDDGKSATKDILPPLKVGQKLDLSLMESPQRFTRPPARYTEASLVKQLEQLGIGRPSTYSPTISKIMDPKRGYVTKESREGEERKFDYLSLKDGKIQRETKSEISGATSNRLYCSDIGMVVTDFLSEHFDEVMDYSFTADIEEQFDIIAEGDLDWKQMLDKFYKPFHDTIEKTESEADRFSGERELGKDPQSGKTLIVRMAKYGPVAQIGTPEELEEGEKPQYANLRKGQSIETIELDEALDLFALPKTIGEYKGDDVVVNIGRYGPYVKFDGKFVSIPRDLDPMEMNMKKALPLIEQKLKEEEPITFLDEKPITRGKGRFGPFLKWDGLYVNIPKKINPEDIDAATALEMVEAKKKKEAERYIHRWDEEKISVQNGRWGPFIKFGKKNVKLPKGKDGKRMTQEEAEKLSLEDVKKIIKKEIPSAFKAKKSTKKKKATSKKKKSSSKSSK